MEFRKKKRKGGVFQGLEMLSRFVLTWWGSDLVKMWNYWSFYIYKS